jgi:IS30 family transposase
LSSSLYLSDIAGKLGTLLYRDKDFLHQKYVIEGLSAAQISSEIGSSKSAILTRLRAFGLIIRDKSQHHGHPAQPRYGQKIIKGRVVTHKGEQEVIAWVQELRKEGLTLRQIADLLKAKGILSKRKSMTWHPQMIRRMLASP